MKKLYFTIIFSMGLLMHFSAFAADEGEVTIRMMQMHETSSGAVINLIELPEAITDKNIDISRQQARSAEGRGQGKLENHRQPQQVGEFEQEIHMEPLQDMQQQHHEFEKDRENQHPGNEQPEGSQNGPGPSGQ